MTHHAAAVCDQVCIKNAFTCDHALTLRVYRLQTMCGWAVSPSCATELKTVRHTLITSDPLYESIMACDIFVCPIWVFIYLGILHNPSDCGCQKLAVQHTFPTLKTRVPCHRSRPHTCLPGSNRSAATRSRTSCASPHPKPHTRLLPSRFNVDRSLPSQFIDWVW